MQNKVVWREGLFIRPQHFQQNDRYYNYELTNRTMQTRHNNWGLFKVIINEHSLNSGKIIIQDISGILPDGTFFDLKSQEDSNLIIDVKSTDSNKLIYLALPTYVQDSDEVHFEEQKSISTRYKAKTVHSMPNTNAGETSSSDILVSRYNFSVLLEDNINESYIKIPIGKIGSVSTSGSVSLDESFTPTYYHFSGSKNLVSKLDELLSTISFRAEKLANKISNSTLQATEIGNYLMLQLLNKSESRFNFLLTQDKIHPDIVFLELVSLAGELAIFMKKEKRLSSQITYKHEEQSSCFDMILEELKSMLTMVLEQNSISLAIEKRKYGIYISALNDKEMVKKSSFIFAVSADVPNQKIKEVLTTSLKIGTVETIKDLVNYHLVGYKIRALSTPPKEIPYRVNQLYFSLELNDENKKELLKSAGFAFHLSSELPNVNYSLWAIKNQ